MLVRHTLSIRTCSFATILTGSVTASQRCSQEGWHQAFTLGSMNHLHCCSSCQLHNSVNVTEICGLAFLSHPSENKTEPGGGWVFTLSGRLTKNFTGLSKAAWPILGLRSAPLGLAARGRPQPPPPPLWLPPLESAPVTGRGWVRALPQPRPATTVFGGPHCGWPQR